MARSAAGRRPKEITAPNRGRRAPAPPRQPKPEDLMFFPRLRNHAKWMFVFLALVFGVGFVVFGVGSSLPSGLGDILRNGGSSSSLPSVSDAEHAIAKNPKDAQAYLDLSRAYQRKGDIDNAVPPLAHYTTLRPKNESALQELAGLYTTQASKASADAQQAQQNYQQVAGLTFQTGPLANFFTPGELDKTLQDNASAAAQAANGKTSTAYQNAADTYDRLVALSPKDSQVRFLDALALESASKYPQAIAAYKAFLRLSPDAPEAAQVKQRIKQLQSQGSASGATAVSGNGVTRINR